MKNIIAAFIFATLLLSFQANAQTPLNRSIMPKAGPAPKINIGDYKSFTLDNGLKVFVVENHKLPRVNFTLTIDIDPILEGDASGYTSIAGDLLGRGTTTRSKSQIDDEIDFMGASLSSSASGISASCLTKHTDKLLTVMSDVLLNPIFPQEELDKLKKQYISGLATQKTSPEAISGNVSKILVYGADNAYGEMMTEKTIENITLDKCVNYYKTYFKPNVAYLVIVGDITLDQAKKATAKYFAAWKKGEVPKIEYKIPAPPAKTRVCYVVKEDAVQSVINVTYPVILKYGTPEVIKSSVMNGILGGGSFSARLFSNLREKHGWTYGAYSYLSPDKYVGVFGTSMTVKANVTDSAVSEVLNEMKRMTTELVDKDHLQLVINSMTGDFARSLESPGTVARFALNTAQYKLPSDYYKTYLERLNKVSAEDVLAMAKQYIKPENALIVIVGPKPDEEKMKKFSAAGEIEYYDIYGNRIIETGSKQLPSNVTPSSILENFVKAVGGQANIEKVTDVTIKSKMEAQGQSIDITSYYKNPNKFLSTVGMGATIFQKQAYDGTTGWTMSRGKTEKMSDKETNAMKYDAVFLNERFYEKWAYKLQVLAVENIDGSDAYAISVTTPDGEVSTEYYDVTTGFKVKQVSEKETQGQKMKVVTKFADYKEVDGVKFPHTITQSAGGMEMILKVSEIDTKTKLADDLFQMK